MPAQAGIHLFNPMDSRIRGNDMQKWGLFVDDELKKLCACKNSIHNNDIIIEIHPSR